MFRFVPIFVLLFVGGCGSKPPQLTQESSSSLLTATVVSYDQNAEWDHFDDGSFAVYDKLTLRLDSSEPLSIALSPTDLSDDSPFRVTGTRFTFSLSDPIDPDVHLAWGAITDPTVIE